MKASELKLGDIIKDIRNESIVEESYWIVDEPGKDITRCLIFNKGSSSSKSFDVGYIKAVEPSEFLFIGQNRRLLKILKREILRHIKIEETYDAYEEVTMAQSFLDRLKAKGKSERSRRLLT